MIILKKVSKLITNTFLLKKTGVDKSKTKVHAQGQRLMKKIHLSVTIYNLCHMPCFYSYNVRQITADKLHTVSESCFGMTSGEQIGVWWDLR